MQIKIRNKTTDISYSVFLMTLSAKVARAEKCARKINAMIEKELCVVCGGVLHNEDVAHSSCYRKEWKNVRLDEGRG